MYLPAQTCIVTTLLCLTCTPSTGLQGRRCCSALTAGRRKWGDALCYVPAATSVGKLYAFLQNALGAVDESWSLLEGQHEGHQWPTSGIAKLQQQVWKSINLWAVQASHVLSWSNSKFRYLEGPMVLYKCCRALSKIWKLCLLLLWSQEHLELILSSLPLPLTSFMEMKEEKTISSLGNSIMWKGGGRLINTLGLWSQLEGQIFVSQMEWCL